MFKNIILAVLIAIVLTYSLGHLSSQWWGMQLTFADHDLQPLGGILTITAVVAIMVVVGFVIAFSLVAALVFAVIAAVIGIFVAGLSVFWPVILFSIVIYLLVKEKSAPAI